MNDGQDSDGMMTCEIAVEMFGAKPCGDCCWCVEC